jgi:hypothetical protein
LVVSLRAWLDDLLLTTAYRDHDLDAALAAYDQLVADPIEDHALKAAGHLKPRPVRGSLHR